MILLFSTSLILSAQTEDSAKFSMYETKILLDRYVNYPKLKAIIGSCDLQERLFKERIQNDSIEKKACEEANYFQGLVVKSQDEQIKFYKKQSKMKGFWKCVSAALFIIGGGEAIYIYGRAKND